MTTKRRLPYLDETGLWKMYLKLLTIKELKELGYYKKHPHSIKWSEYQVPKADIIRLYQEGYTGKRISMLLKTSPMTVDRVIKKWKGGEE